MLDPSKIKWVGEDCHYTRHTYLFDGLIEIHIDIYPPTPKGNAYGIKIRGLKTHTVANKVWLENVEVAKTMAIEHLNKLLEDGCKDYESR